VGTESATVSAEPTLVLLPGMDGTGLLFAPFIAALQGACEVVALAYPNDRPLGYDALRDWALAALPAVGPLVLLGESFSGPVAIALAAALPERTKGLVLCCTFVRNPWPELSWLKPLARVLPPPPARAAAGMLFGRCSTLELRAMLARSLATLAPAVLRARLRAVIDVDASATLATVRTPILYLRADEDRLVPRSALTQIEELVPGMRVMRFEAPHALLQTCPAETAKAVADFMRELGAAR